jgi:Domain of unknown function (DUF4440)
MKKGLLMLILMLGTTASILGQTPSENPRQEKAKDEEHLRRINELIELERSRTVLLVEPERSRTLLLVEPERSSKPAIDEDIVRRLEKGIFAVRFPLPIPFAVRFLRPIPQNGSVTKRFQPADLNTILAEDYIRIGAGGEIITRQQEIENPQLSVYPGFVDARVNDLRIGMYGETGIATSLLIIKESRSGVEEIRKYRVTNVYVKRDNRWQLVSSKFTSDQG